MQCPAILGLRCRLLFQIHQKIGKLDLNILGFLNKPKSPENCVLRLPNPHSAASVYCVLNRIFWIDWFYCVLVQVTHNRSAHFCILNRYLLLSGLNFGHEIQPQDLGLMISQPFLRFENRQYVGVIQGIGHHFSPVLIKWEATYNRQRTSIICCGRSVI